MMAYDDAHIVSQVQDGETDAFRSLVDRHAHRIFQLAYRITGNGADADDVVQETFLRAYKALGQFDFRARFSTWLHRIASNCAIDLIRRRAPENELDQAADQEPRPEPGPERLAMSSEIADRVSTSLQQLSARERSAFVLRHFEGMSIREIGEALELKDSATKHTIFRAVHKLRDSLAPLTRSA